MPLDVDRAVFARALSEVAQDGEAWDIFMNCLTPETKAELAGSGGRGSMQSLAVPFRAETGAEAILDKDNSIESLWGFDSGCLWAAGEPLYICASTGMGKTTLAQQLMLCRVGIRNELLDLPVAVDAGRVLYIMADRPRQALRSIRRMVSERDREALDAALLIWEGPPPNSLSAAPEAFLPWVQSFGEVGTVVIDSLMNVAFGLAEDEGGTRTNEAIQSLVRAGIEVMVLHHDRKRGEGERRVKIDDIYGHRSLTAGAGSVIYLAGEPNTAFVTLHHLKQPAEGVGPLDLQHNFTKGETTISTVDREAYSIVFS